MVLGSSLQVCRILYRLHRVKGRGVTICEEFDTIIEEGGEDGLISYMGSG